MLTEAQRIDCENYVLRRSWRVRLTSQRSRRLIWHCLDMMPYYMETMDEAWLHGEMMEETNRTQPTTFTRGRLRTKNPLVLWLILQVVLPALIRLVVEWWLTRRRGEA